MRDGAAAGSLRARLALAFVAVAVTAVAALAAVVFFETRSETKRVSDSDRRQAAGEVARALERAYRTGGSWADADSGEARALAAREDAVLVLRDAQGRVLLEPAAGPGARRGAGRHAAVLTAPVTVGTQRVGTAELRFPGALGRDEQRLRSALGRAVLLGSAIAIAVALMVAALVSRRIARPLRRLTATARRLRAGDLAARAEQAGTAGELGELAQAFDAMADALEREERARRLLVADLSHELRTPITILRGNLEELIDGIDQPTPGRLASLHEEVLRLDSLIAQLDALGRAGAPVLGLDRAPVNLADVTATEVEAVRTQLAAKSLTVHPALTPVTVHGDRGKLGQVVANLLSNALKFTPDGGHIDVSVGEVDAATARLVVGDDGPGITPADREHVFERFWRGRAAGAVAGRGIGLAVVDEIVRAHGGRITVDTSPRGGARFTAMLPCNGNRTGTAVTAGRAADPPPRPPTSARR